MTPENRYVIIHEGSTDRRLIEAVVEPVLSARWSIEKWKSATMSRTEKNQIVRRSIMRKFPVVVVCDLDTYPCIRARRGHEQELLQAGQTVCVTVVVKEIEGWYLAGMPNHLASKLKFSIPADVESVSKEDFAMMASRASHSAVQLMTRILEVFDVSLARTRSRSFDYFWVRWVEPFSVPN